METTSYFPSNDLSQASADKPLGLLARVRAWNLRRAVRRTLRLLRDSVPPDTHAFTETRFVEDENFVGQPSARSVPMPSRALTALLNQHDAARGGLADLACVETTLRLAGDSNPLAFLRLPILESALRQLNLLVDVRKDAELALLDLQLRRRIGELQARQQATGSLARPVLKTAEVDKPSLAAQLYESLFREGDQRRWDRHQSDFQPTQAMNYGDEQ